VTLVMFQSVFLTNIHLQCKQCAYRPSYRCQQLRRNYINNNYKLLRQPVLYIAYTCYNRWAITTLHSQVAERAPLGPKSSSRCNSRTSPGTSPASWCRRRCPTSTSAVSVVVLNQPRDRLRCCRYQRLVRVQLQESPSGSTPTAVAQRRRPSNDSARLRGSLVDSGRHRCIPADSAESPWP